MIVRPGHQVVHLITQPDHAALARRIMEHCTPLADVEQRESILLAIGEHDNGWRELDESPTIDASGRIVDFISAANEPKQAVWPRGVSRLARDPYAAALVAHHAVFVYDRFRADPEWAAFFPRMEAMRDRLLAESRRSHDELLRDYLYVRLGDLISLTFCTAWTDEQKHDGWSVRRESDRVLVSPDRFDAVEIPFEVPARELSEPAFPSEADFRDAFDTARQVTLAGSLVPRP